MSNTTASPPRVYRRSRRVNRGLTPRQAGSLATIPSQVANMVKKAYTSEASPIKAIAATCMECVGFEDYRTGIRECDAQLCPLWAYRPYQVKSEATNGS